MVRLELDRKVLGVDHMTVTSSLTTCCRNKDLGRYEAELLHREVSSAIRALWLEPLHTTPDNLAVCSNFDRR